MPAVGMKEMRKALLHPPDMARYPLPGLAFCPHLIGTVLGPGPSPAQHLEWISGQVP